MRRSRKKNSFFVGTSFDQVREDINVLWKAGLPPIVSRRAFTVLFGVSPRLIPRMIGSPGIYWRQFQLPKRSGGFRVIQTPRVFLKTFQLFILQNILAKRASSTSTYGFTKGRGCFQNASAHLKKKYVVNLDIRDFFPSVTYSRVSEIFKQFGFPLEGVETLTSLCTLNGVLPQGAPTSPKLADLAFAVADAELDQVASAHGAIYTRYADDLTFSFDNVPSSNLVNEVVRVVDRFGFRLNHDKTRIAGPGQARRVTGFVINEKVQPSRVTRRQLRAMFHNMKNDPPASMKDLNVAQGWASYVNSYNSSLGQGYLTIVRATREHINEPRNPATSPD